MQAGISKAELVTVAAIDAFMKYFYNVFQQQECGIVFGCLDEPLNAHLWKLYGSSGQNPAKFFADLDAEKQQQLVDAINLYKSRSGRFKRRQS